MEITYEKWEKIFSFRQDFTLSQDNVKDQEQLFYLLLGKQTLKKIHHRNFSI